MFVGEYLRSIDNKGRLFIPAKLRENLSKKVIIAKGYDEQCLFVYPIENWEKLQEKILGGAIAKKDKQDFLRIFSGRASEQEIDQQGRIKIDQKFSDFAEIEKDVVLVGVSERIEIWAKDKWEKFSEEVEAKFLKDREKFEQLGF